VTAEIAPQTDRLVWAVADRLRDQYARGELPDLAVLPAGAFSRTINLVQFMHPDIGEDFIRRRYVYASDEQVSDYFDELVDGGFFERVGERLRPTDQLPALLASFDRAISDSARAHWQVHAEVVESVLPLTRQVLEACPEPEMLLAAALVAPEAEDRYQLLYQRLAALRLLRNEAHVRAWRAHGLAPGEVEVLTSAWAGSKTQGSSEPTASMVEQGLAADGVVTKTGLELRQAIEDETNAGVAAAFAVVNREEFLGALHLLRGPLT
jgi:hypothetical protein